VTTTLLILAALAVSFHLGRLFGSVGARVDAQIAAAKRMRLINEEAQRAQCGG